MKIGRKTNTWIFQATNKRNITKEDMDMVKRRNLQKETESFRTALLNNAIRTKYVKVKNRERAKR